MEYIREILSKYKIYNEKGELCDMLETDLGKDLICELSHHHKPTDIEETEKQIIKIPSDVEVYQSGKYLADEIDALNKDEVKIDLNSYIIGANYVKDFVLGLCYCTYPVFSTINGRCMGCDKPREYKITSIINKNNNDSWNEIFKEHGTHADLEEGEDTERLDDLMSYLRMNYYVPRQKPSWIKMYLK